MATSDSKVQPIGALSQWRAELRARVAGQYPERPSTWRDDALFRAACHEANALEAERAGLPRLAALYMERAASTIADAVREKSAA